jgi:uncharacterized membrane protein
MVQSGDSAIFALRRTANPELVAEHFRGYGGAILRTTLSGKQRTKIETVLSGR